MTLCCPICAKERAQILDPLIGSKYFTMYFIAFLAFLSSLYLSVHRVGRCSSTIGTGCCTFYSTCCWYEWHQRRRIRGQSSPLSCAVKAHVQNEENVGSGWNRLVRRHWSYGCGWQAWPLLLSHLPQRSFGVDSRSTWSSEALSRCQIFCPWPATETRDIWLAVIGLWWKPLSKSELEGQRERIPWRPLVIRDWEYPFAEDLIVDGSGAPDATVPVLAKVSSMIEVLRLGGPYELVHQLWSQVSLPASRLNIDVTWSRDEVLVGNFLFHVSTFSFALAYWCCVLVNHFEWDVTPHPFQCVRLDEGSWTVQHRIWRARLRDLGDRADVEEIHISPCLCCGVEPTQDQYYPGELRFRQKFWMLLVQMHLLCQHGGPHVLAEAIWEVGTMPSSRSTPHLTSGWWSVASSGRPLLSLGALTRSQRRNLWWTAWRAQRLGTGWCLVPHCEKPLLRTTFPCQA